MPSIAKVFVSSTLVVFGLMSGPAVFAQSAPAAEPAPPRVKPFDDKLDALRRDFFKLYGDVLFSAKVKDCQDADCDIDVTMDWTEYNGKLYCIATVPETITFKWSNTGVPRNIRWKLSTTTLKGRMVEFHPFNGILTVLDNNGQLNPRRQRTSQDVYEATNSHSKPKSVATYVPVVLWTDTATPGATPELCAAGDPKIENN